MKPLLLIVTCLYFLSFAVFSQAAVTLQPTSMVITIPTGQTSAWGSVVTTNTGPGAVTLTWLDTMSCMHGLIPVTRTLAIGQVETWSLRADCAQTGTATLTGSGVSFMIPVIATVGVALVPGPPGNLTVIAKPSPVTASVRLTWTPNGETDLAGYKIYRGTAPGIYGPPTQIGTMAAPEVFVNGLPTGATYYFAVTAYDTSGQESPKSNMVSKSIP